MFPKAKRLRGSQLQIAMDAFTTSRQPLPKGEQPSALAHLLLSLWSHGHLSASLIQQLAHMAILDGASHPELVSMAWLLFVLTFKSFHLSASRWK